MKKDQKRGSRGAAPTAFEMDDDEYTEPETTHKPTGTSRKKNKPMKAVEQEERIKTLEARLNTFKEGSGSEQASPTSITTSAPAQPPFANQTSDHQDESDDEESEESEEE